MYAQEFKMCNVKKEEAKQGNSVAYEDLPKVKKNENPCITERKETEIKLTFRLNSVGRVGKKLESIQYSL